MNVLVILENGKIIMLDQVATDITVAFKSSFFGRLISPC